MSHSGTYDRYQRQMILKGFGAEAQDRLFHARVLVVGAGGLGCPVLLYLGGAGVGTIGIVDDDRISVHNLHRQPIFTTGEVGQRKADVAASRIGALNPDIHVVSHPVRLTNAVCLELFPQYDYILDCTDNFETRYMINDACVLLGKTLVSGAVSQYEGQVSIFNHPTAAQPDPVNYRDIFPEPPAAGEVLNCADAGVLGSLPGVIGSMMAGELIKLITGIGEPLVNRLLTYDMLQHRFFDLEISRRPVPASMPLSREAFLQTDYAWLCGWSSAVEEVDPETFNRMLEDPGTQVVDVREHAEQPAVTEFEHIKHPLGQIGGFVPEEGKHTVVFFCQSGKRSAEAVRNWKDAGGTIHKVYSLSGGILRWKSINDTAHV
jgi:adenylyltransferase/sulfurtransferase